MNIIIIIWELASRVSKTCEQNVHGNNNNGE